MQELIKKNKENIVAHRLNFRHTFGRELTAFMHPLLGFDVIAFDDYLKTPDGQSTNDFITEKYGEAACEMIHALL